jgi:hypothetical protein
MQICTPLRVVSLQCMWRKLNAQVVEQITFNPVYLCVYQTVAVAPFLRRLKLSRMMGQYSVHLFSS